MAHDHHHDTHNASSIDVADRARVVDRVPAGHADHEHDHGAHHDHGHHDGHGPANYDRVFAFGIALNLTIVVLQLVFGWLAGSLALLADAGHNLSDILALILAWGAAVLGRRQPSGQRTYGWRRLTILAALANALSLVVVTGAIIWEAVHRLLEPAAIDAGTIIWVAALGAIINTATALMFQAGRHHDMNLRGAFLHMAADAAVSVGVALAGAVILFTGWVTLDAIVSIVVGVVILYSAWGLMRDAGNLILDAAPVGIDITKIRVYLSSLPQVAEVHDLHVWAMSTTEVALTAHLVTDQEPPYDALLAEVCGELHAEFGISHTTLQLERGDPDYPCVLVTTRGV